LSDANDDDDLPGRNGVGERNVLQHPRLQRRQVRQHADDDNDDLPDSDSAGERNVLQHP
jgi:hypothetical protein